MLAADLARGGAEATSERILLVAMRLFAEQGVDRVSLKDISDAAGNRNKSAVGYHFENKRGLINALLRRLDEDLSPSLNGALTVFENRIRAGQPLTVEEVVVGLLEPGFWLFAAKPYGSDALRVLARLMHDPLEGIPKDLLEKGYAEADRALAILSPLIPDKPPWALQLLIHHTVMATINGLALRRRFVAERASLWGEESFSEMFLSYAGFIAAGFTGGGIDISPAIRSRWVARLDEVGTATEPTP